MDKIVKLLQKISPQNRLALLTIMERLLAGDKNLMVVKLKKTNFCRLRYKNFRIIFHKEKNTEKSIVIDSIKLRNEKTYKNL